MVVTTEAERLTAGEAGRLLNLGPQRVRDLCDAKILPSERTASGVRLILRQDVEKLARDRAKSARRGR